MKWLKKLTKHIYGYWHRKWLKAHYRNYKAFNACFKNNDAIRLSSAVPGTYKFIKSCCDERLDNRLMELGLIPGDELTVIRNTGLKGTVMVKIKGSKIALSNKIADKILLKGR